MSPPFHKRVTAGFLAVALAGAPVQAPNLVELTEQPYLDLLEQAVSLRFSEDEIDAARDQLDDDRRQALDALEDEEDRLGDERSSLRDDLDRLNRAASRDTPEAEAERADIHCRIDEIETRLRDIRTERDHGIPTLYANKEAKIDLITQWRATYGAIRAAIVSGTARERRYGDVEDIGYRDLGDRELAEHQTDDIELGEDAVRELRSRGLMPNEVDDETLNEYVRRLADRIAESSDLHVPLRVTVLSSEEINAFALPGGYLYVNLALVAKAETESELAGVLAHEIAHTTARHGPKLMRRATIANILLQAVQVAALILSGGSSALVTGGLQYGFYGIAMALDLTLLGVNREYESEADQLGVQYAWNAGYDPRGFVTFFDKMASTEGYVQATSFFRTHPPFYDRIVSTFSEIEYLPPKENLIVDSSEFQEARRIAERLVESPAGTDERPRLRRPGDPCLAR